MVKLTWVINYCIQSFVEHYISTRGSVFIARCLQIFVEDKPSARIEFTDVIRTQDHLSSTDASPILMKCCILLVGSVYGTIPVIHFVKFSAKRETEILIKIRQLLIDSSDCRMPSWALVTIKHSALCMRTAMTLWLQPLNYNSYTNHFSNSFSWLFEQSLLRYFIKL